MSAEDAQHFAALSCAGQHEMAVEVFTNGIVLPPLDAGVCAATDRPRFQAMVQSAAVGILGLAAERLTHYACLVEGWDAPPDTGWRYETAARVRDEHNHQVAPTAVDYTARYLVAVLTVAVLRGELAVVLPDVVSEAYAAGLLSELAAVVSGTLWHYFTEHQMSQAFPQAAI